MASFARRIERCSLITKVRAAQVDIERSSSRSFNLNSLNRFAFLISLPITERHLQGTMGFKREVKDL